MQHPKVLRAVAKALVKRTDIMSPEGPRKTRAGKVVRFTQWAERIAELADQQPKTRLICSDVFGMDIGESGRIAWCAPFWCASK